MKAVKSILIFTKSLILEGYRLLTLTMCMTIFQRGIPLANALFTERGMHTPMIQRKAGKTRSPATIPFHVACSIHQYPPAPSFTKIMNTIAILIISKTLMTSWYVKSRTLDDFDDKNVIFKINHMLGGCI